jgi:hypothetical protein
MVEYKKILVFSRSYTTSANIDAGAVSAENFISQEDIDTYAPFDTLQILNSDNVHLGLLFDLNPDNMTTISANGTTGGDVQKFAQFAIKNLDAAVAHTAGKIYILVQKTKYVPIENEG